MTLSKSQLAILEYAARPNASPTATHWFTVHMATPGATTDEARRLLNRLKAIGLMEGVETQHSGRVYWWKITDQGRRIWAFHNVA